MAYTALASTSSLLIFEKGVTGVFGVKEDDGCVYNDSEVVLVLRLLLKELVC